MDAVITYVNGNDPLWMADYAANVGGDMLTKRFRDWGTLKYLLRGIEKHLPFIDNIFLVVARESQVPVWVDRHAVNVIMHKDFVPPEYLPTFNCNTLEVFLHRIPGLSERYIYFNDDMFPFRDMHEEDFFVDGKAVVWFKRHFLALNMYKKICRESDRLARRLSGAGKSVFFLRPQHTPSAMLRSTCEEAFEHGEDKIKAAISSVRTGRNHNQYLFTDYLFYRGETVRKRVSNRHFSLAVSTVGKIRAFIDAPYEDMACINDVEMNDERFNALRVAMLESFEKAFPRKSRFEL